VRSNSSNNEESESCITNKEIQEVIVIADDDGGDFEIPKSQLDMEENLAQYLDKLVDEPGKNTHLNVKIGDRKLYLNTFHHANGHGKPPIKNNRMYVDQFEDRELYRWDLMGAVVKSLKQVSS
jgi:hypothetical protein